MLRRDVTQGDLRKHEPPWLGGLRDGMVRWLLPAGCLGCGKVLGAGRQPLGLCSPCRGRLVTPGAVRCFRCARPLGAARVPPGFLCAGCRRRPPAFEKLRAAWVYRPPLDAVIRGLKFTRLEYLGSHLASGMAELLRHEVGACDCVVAVPLHWRRRWARGFDQARAIAEPLAAELGLPFRVALARRRATPPQSSLDRKQRLASPRDAFRRSLRLRLAPGSVRGTTVLLVDDVVTTSATLDAAARELLRAGAGRVVAVAAARTPGRDEPVSATASLSGDATVTAG